MRPRPAGARRARRWAALALAALFGGVAHAGGQFLPVRGVRPAGRGGAFVAGADDPSALWYNPAGLAALLGGPAARELLLDAAWVGHSVTYTRVDSGGNTLAPVRDDAQPAPLPTLAAEIDLSSRLALGLGAYAPWSALDGYPETGAQRYAMVSLHDSAFAIVEAALAWRVGDALSVGVGLQDLITRFHSRMVFSACPGEIVCAPEDPEFDAVGEIDATRWFTPSAVLGATLRPHRMVTLGAAVQLPFSLSAPGTVRVRLPASGFFDGAHVAGDRATVALRLPLMVRGGVQVAPSPRLRLEAGADWEAWSQQDAITITPQGVSVEDAGGVGTYAMGPIRLPRGLANTLALRAGLEARPLARVPVVVRAGYVHETGASRAAYLSVLTVDTTKNVLTLGLGVRIGRARLDAVVGHVFMADAVVAPGESCVPQVNPIRSGEPQTGCVHDADPGHVYVGDGTYRSSWTLAGAGMTLDF